MQLGHTRVALFPRKGWVCGRRNRVAGHAHCLTLGAPSHRPDLSDACGVLCKLHSSTGLGWGCLFD